MVSNADVNAKNNQGDTPLHIVTDQGRKDLAEFLLANGAAANAKNNVRRTPLHSAGLLLGSNADVNARDTIGSAAHTHAPGGWWGHREVAELLLASKAEVNARANDGATPLHDAAANGHIAVAELMLAYARGGRNEPPRRG